MKNIKHEIIIEPEKQLLIDALIDLNFDHENNLWLWMNANFPKRIILNIDKVLTDEKLVILLNELKNHSVNFVIKANYINQLIVEITFL